MGKRGPPKGERHGGRKKGTPNKSTLALEDICAKKGLNVFEAMVEIAATHKDVFIRMAMLKELAQYLYAKRRSTEVTVKSELEIEAERFSTLPPEKQAELLEQQAKKLRGEI